MERYDIEIVVVDGGQQRAKKKIAFSFYGNKITENTFHSTYTSVACTLYTKSYRARAHGRFEPAILFTFVNRPFCVRPTNFAIGKVLSPTKIRHPRRPNHSNISPSTLTILIPETIMNPVVFFSVARVCRHDTSQVSPST